VAMLSEQLYVCCVLAENDSKGFRVHYGLLFELRVHEPPHCTRGHSSFHIDEWMRHLLVAHA
jgi:hypothetical protein